MISRAEATGKQPRGGGGWFNKMTDLIVAIDARDWDQMDYLIAQYKTSDSMAKNLERVDYKSNNKKCKWSDTSSYQNHKRHIVR